MTILRRPHWLANPIDKCKMVPVIQVSLVRGVGVEDDPVRHVKQYWTLDGKLLADLDPEYNAPPPQEPSA